MKKISNTKATGFFLKAWDLELRAYEYGFTLIEVLLSLALVAIIAAMSVSAFVTLDKKEAVRQETGKVIALLNEARTLSISGENGDVYGVHFETTKTVLFKGSVYSAVAETNKVQMLNDAVQVSAITLSAGGSDVIFKKLTGATSQFGTITLASLKDPSATSTVTITATGVAY